MKSIYSPKVVRFRMMGAVSIAVVFLLSIVSLPAAQEGGVTLETESQRIYRQVYEAAAADGIISPDEEQMLQALERAMGLHEDVIDEALGETLRPLPPGPQQSGRWTLVAQNMAWGLGLYGWGIPHVLDVEDFKWTIGGEMLSLGATFYLTWKYTENMDLPEARSQMQRSGGLVGLRYGLTISGLLGFDVEEDLNEKSTGHVALMMAGVPLGTYLGDRLYRRWTPTTGQAYALGLNGFMTARWIYNLYSWLKPPPEDYLDEEDPNYDEQEYNDWRKEYVKYASIRRLFEVTGYPLGTYLGHRFFGARQYSFGDASMLYLGWGGGLLYGLLLADLIDIDTDETAWLMANTTAVGGVLAVNRYIRGYDYTFGQTALMGLGAGAGAAFAAGLGVIMDIEESGFYDIAVIGGSLGGFFITRRIVNPRLELATAGRSGKQPQLNLALQPAVVGGVVLPTLGIEARW